MTPLRLAAAVALAGTWLQVQSPPTFRSASDLVVVHVSVRDGHGQPVANLTKDVFAILEDGQPRPVSTFMAEDEPATIGLVLDNSISMRTLRDRIIGAAVTFAKVSHPSDDLFALAFNEHVAPALAPDAPFTSDAAALQGALETSIISRGKTALFDAVIEGLAYAKRGRYERQALVLVSDGGDNASTASFEDALRRAESSNVVIYGVVLQDPADTDAKPKVLKRLAEATGGETVDPKGPKQMGEALERMARAIRHTYTLGFVPAAPADGAFHRLRVVLTGRRGLDVRARAGYLAVAPGAGGH